MISPTIIICLLFRHVIVIPVEFFACNGHRWRLKVYPATSDLGRNRRGLEIRFVSFLLEHLSEGSVTVTFELNILDMYKSFAYESSFEESMFDSENSSFGSLHFVERTTILDAENAILDNNGTLVAVGMFMKEDPTSVNYVPKYPSMKMITERSFEI